MFEVSIEAEEFRGQKTVKQHMMVNQVNSLAKYFTTSMFQNESYVCLVNFGKHSLIHKIPFFVF